MKALRHACIAAIASLALHAENLTENESLFFTGESRGVATARLLRTPDATPVLKSSSLEVTYEAGRDFLWQPGSRDLQLTADSRIPFKTSAELHPKPNSPNSYKAQRDSENWMFYGPGRVMHDLQAAATYASSDDWSAPKITPAPDAQLGGFRAKLKSGQPVKIVVLGDSISTEADASALSKTAPNQPGYPTLIARKLEASTGAKVTLRNLSKGGMDAVWGVSRTADAIAEQPDLFIVAFGMNDASGRRTTEAYSDSIRKIIDPVRAALPGCCVILVSTMTANEEWSHSAHDLYPHYAGSLSKLTGDGIALADVTAAWTAIASRKKHMDLSGNGLNHPNDYGHRIYADVILRTIGL
jgi:lysophospholipase L1-like esterase